MKCWISFVLALLHIAEVLSDETRWSYGFGKNKIGRLILAETPNDWWMLEPACKGKEQSPIDIEFTKTKFERDIGPIEILKSSDKNESWEMVNNGKTVKLIPLNVNFRFNLLPRNETYELSHVHFHWRGSEHFINSQKLAGEIHLVFRSEIKEHYSVIGYMIKIITDNNANMSPIINELSSVLQFNTSTFLHGVFKLEDIVPLKVTDFYRYHGSLTTPGCNEIVEWNVVDKPVLTLSDEQILKLQSLLDNDGYPILSNARPIQQLNGRTVLRSFDPFMTERDLSLKILKRRSFFSPLVSKLVNRR